MRNTFFSLQEENLVIDMALPIPPRGKSCKVLRLLQYKHQQNEACAGANVNLESLNKCLT